jgi:hypothetical protein
MTEQNREPVDLTSLLPENFSEIAYITQIMEKKKTMESINAELAKLVYPICREVEAKDYTSMFNVIVHVRFFI